MPNFNSAVAANSNAEQHRVALVECGAMTVEYVFGRDCEAQADHDCGALNRVRVAILHTHGEQRPIEIFIVLDRQRRSLGLHWADIQRRDRDPHPVLWCSERVCSRNRGLRELVPGTVGHRREFKATPTWQVSTKSGNQSPCAAIFAARISSSSTAV